MMRFLKFIFVLLALICLALIIWFVGPLVAIGSLKPLEGSGIRWFLIYLIFGLWIGYLLVAFWRRKNMNEFLFKFLETSKSKPEAPVAQGTQEVQVLQSEFRESLNKLKKTRFGSPGKFSWLGFLSKQYIYQLPWYIFIGAPGSGKTTALRQSGLSFPSEEQFGKEALRAVGGTLRCDWWFTNEAILLDTAGRYTTHESNTNVDKAEWEGFLGLLKKFRPRQPINGVLLTISIHDLLTKTSSEKQLQINAFKARLGELRDALGIQIPVYVMVTKTDLLAGFNEAFASLDKKERAQVWGFTSPYDPQQRTAFDFKKWYGEEFQLLLSRLHGGMPKMLQAEQDLGKRALIYSLPQQFAGIQEPLSQLIEPLFQPSRFAQPPLLRGVYFTSGTQEGSPLDRVLSAIKKRFSDARANNETRSMSGKPAVELGKGVEKGYFVQDLMQTVIFPESYLAGRNIKWERKATIARYIGYALVLLLFIGLSMAWAISYTHNKNYIEEVKGKTQELAKSLAAPDLSANDSILGLLPTLNYARDLAVSQSFQLDSPPHSYRYGLYQGNKIESATNTAYARLLEDGLLPAVAKRIETDLQQAPQDNLDYSYEALKVYLMLYDGKHYDGESIRDWVELSLKRSLPPETPKATFEQIEGHLSILLTDKVNASPFPKNDALVAKTRDLLQRYTPAQRAYGRLKKQLSGKSIPDFTVISAAGPQAELVFARTSGQPLTRGVPGLFTYNGYHDLFNKKVDELALHLGEQEGWIMGDNAEVTVGSSVQQVTALVHNELGNEVRRLYLNEYIKTWDDFLADVHLIRATSLQKNIESTRILSAPDSPLAAFLRAAGKETTLVRPDDKQTSLADKAASKIQTYRNDLNSLLGTKDTPAPQASNRPELMVDTHFDALHHLVQAGPNGGPAPIDSTLQLLNDLYVDLSATDAALKAGNTPTPSVAIPKTMTEAARQPQPLRDMLTDLSTSSAGQVQVGTRGNISANVDATIGKFCRTALSDRYPFARTSAKDVTADDFAQMFAPGGLMDDFFQKNLQSMVDVSTNPWSFKKGIDGSSFGGSEGLAAFQRAAVIRDVYFRGGAKVPSLKLEIKPIDMDANIIQFSMDIDGQLFKYSHGPQIPMPVTWPGSRGSQQVRVQLSPQLPGTNGLVGDGPWALHRLFDKAQIRAGNAPEKFFATFTVEGRNIELEVTGNSVYNPFRLRELMEFKCPSSL